MKIEATPLLHANIGGTLEKVPAGIRFPAWLRRPSARGGRSPDVVEALKSGHLHTVCDEAKCPNRGECFSSGTATFLIMGDVCSRSCGYCNVTHGSPVGLNPEEPQNLANAARQMKLKHVVITSVTRDDLPDGGSRHFAGVIRAVREQVPQATIEVLTPDFKGLQKDLITVFDAQPDVFNHNVETVPRLFAGIRPQADYTQSLKVLSFAASYGTMKVKSGFMVGLGESAAEVESVLKDLKSAGCSIVTIGQYLRPNTTCIAVKEYVSPETFGQYEAFGRNLGIEAVYAGPYVRSSYRAGHALHAVRTYNVDNVNLTLQQEADV
jgi:lipoic acid synthetase